MTRNALTADYSITPRQLFVALHALTRLQRPAMVWGPPGIAKSDVAKAVARAGGMEYRDIRALLLDPVDLRGIPWRDQETGQTRWAPPAFLPPSDSQGGHLINLEELPNATPMVQSALYQLVLDRQIGEYELPDGAAVIACGNRVSDRGGAHRMPTPLANRFVHLNLMPDIEEWMGWATGNGLPKPGDLPEPDVAALRQRKEDGQRICTEVIFFLQWRPNLLNLFDPRREEQAFATPRTWEMASDFLSVGGSGDEAVDIAILSGTVGEGPAVELLSFLDIWKGLPHPRTILESPHDAVIPEDESTKIALCGALANAVEPETMEALTTYARRLRAELGEFLIGQTAKIKPDCRATTAYIEWAAEQTYQS